MTLYRKYRPQKIAEIDSEKAREFLKNLISSGRMPHGFLFSGPRGAGKTSAARVLAKILNCERNEKKLGEPCNKCSQCIAISSGSSLDVIEMDAASNRGIDDIRTLREGIGLATSGARKKVYIIDEAHMLTTEAANALLKTLEEPPEHVVFILATTDEHKLPATVVSRLSILAFEKASHKEIERMLKRVIEGEKVKAEEGVAQGIAAASDGSFRDAVKILEQLIITFPKLTLRQVGDYLSRNRVSTSQELFDAISAKDAKGALEEIEKVASGGANMRSYLDGVLERLRGALLVKEGMEGEDIVSLSADEVVALLELLAVARREMNSYPLAQMSLEVAIAKWCGSQKVVVEEIKVVTQPKVEATLKEKKIETTAADVEKVEVVGDVSAIEGEIWGKILREARARNTSIEALLRAAKPMDFDGKVLKIGVYYKFHKERLEVGQYKLLLEEVVGGVLGTPIRIVCSLTQKPDRPMREATDTLTEPPDKDIIEAAKEIFGA